MGCWMGALLGRPAVLASSWCVRSWNRMSSLWQVLLHVVRRAETSAPRSMAAEHIPHWTILEYCKQTKPDVPSGTARELAELMGDVRKAPYVLDVSQHVGDTTSLRADVAGSRVHAVRLPGITEAAVEVLFGFPGERLSIRHEPSIRVSLSRQLTVRWTAERPLGEPPQRRRSPVSRVDARRRALRHLEPWALCRADCGQTARKRSRGHDRVTAAEISCGDATRHCR